MGTLGKREEEGVQEGKSWENGLDQSLPSPETTWDEHHADWLWTMRGGGPWYVHMFIHFKTLDAFQGISSLKISVLIVYYCWCHYLLELLMWCHHFVSFPDYLFNESFHIRIQAASFPSACKVQELKDSAYLLTIVFALQNKWEYFISLLSPSSSPGFYWPLSRRGLPQNFKEDDLNKEVCPSVFHGQKLILQQLNHLLKFIYIVLLG